MMLTITIFTQKESIKSSEIKAFEDVDSIFKYIETLKTEGSSDDYMFGNSNAKTAALESSQFIVLSLDKNVKPAFDKLQDYHAMFDFFYLLILKATQLR